MIEDWRAFDEAKARIDSARGPAGETGDLIERTPTQREETLEARATLDRHNVLVLEKRLAEAAARLAALQQERDEARAAYGEAIEGQRISVALASSLQRRVEDLEQHKRLQAEDIMTLGQEVGRLTVALQAAREVVNAIVGENQPSRSWASVVQGKIDAALAPPEQGGGK